MDAKYLLSVLELFDNKLSVDDIINMDLSLLNNLQKEKINEIEIEAKNKAKLEKENNDKMGIVVNGNKKEK